jgi:hypothetical protein
MKFLEAQKDLLSGQPAQFEPDAVRNSMPCRAEVVSILAGIPPAGTSQKGASADGVKTI